MDRSELSAMSVTELKQHAGAIGMKGYQKLRKAELVEAILTFASTDRAQTPAQPTLSEDSDQAPSAVRASVDDHPSAPALDETPEPAQAGNTNDGDDAATLDDTASGEHDGRGRDGDRRSRRRTRREEGARRDDNNNRRERSGKVRREDTRNDGRSDTRGDGRNEGRGDSRNEPETRRDERVEEVVIEEDKGPEVRAGVLDILPEGYGFLRTTGYLPGSRDVYVSQGQIRKYGLRRGDIVQGPIRPQRSNDKVPALDIVEMVNAYEVDDPADLPERIEFDQLPAIKAEEPLVLPGSQVTINRGQRMLIGVPQGVLVTEMLADIAAGLAEHNDTAHLMVVAVDEAPEEITLLRRAIPGEVIASAFDRPADDHTQVADLALERAKRLVEEGWDVIVVLHSLTRLAKAWSLCAPGAQRTISGGLEPAAIHPVKRWLGAGRNLDGEGSLTVITTMDTNTGRPVDDVIADQFSYLANARIMIAEDKQGNLTITS